MVSFTHEQTIICRQLFAGHLVGSWPMKRKNSLSIHDTLYLLERVNYGNLFLIQGIQRGWQRYGFHSNYMSGCSADGTGHSDQS